MTTESEIFDIYAQNYDAQKQSEMPLKEYLEQCKSDPSLYGGAAERMIKAIGEPHLRVPFKQQVAVIERHLVILFGDPARDCLVHGFERHAHG